MELWQQIVGGVAIAGIVGVVKYVRDLKRKVHELEIKLEGMATKEALGGLERSTERHASKESLEGLRLQMKDLERTDALQQKTLDQLNDLFPVLKRAVDVLAQQKKK